MKHSPPTDYETFKEIIYELLSPIDDEGLDIDTLKSLYESKLVYLENLRIKCFLDINHGKNASFSQEDYKMILKAINQTNNHLHDLVVMAVSSSLLKRAV